MVVPPWHPMAEPPYDPRKEPRTGEEKSARNLHRRRRSPTAGAAARRRPGDRSAGPVAARAQPRPVAARPGDRAAPFQSAFAARRHGAAIGTPRPDRPAPVVQRWIRRALRPAGTDRRRGAQRRLPAARRLEGGPEPETGLPMGRVAARRGAAAGVAGLHRAGLLADTRNAHQGRFDPRYRAPFRLCPRHQFRRIFRGLFTPGLDRSGVPTDRAGSAYRQPLSNAGSRYPDFAMPAE